MDREDWIWEEAKQLAISLRDTELENLPEKAREALLNKAESNYRETEYNKLVELWE